MYGEYIKMSIYLVKKSTYMTSLRLYLWILVKYYLKNAEKRSFQDLMHCIFLLKLIVQDCFLASKWTLFEFWTVLAARISLIGAPSDPKIFFPPINVLNMSWDQNSMIWALEKIGTFNLILMLKMVRFMI